MTLPTDPSYSTMPPGPHPLGGVSERLRHRWGWFVGFGALAAILGLAALVLVVSATIASVLTIAIFMIITGGMEVLMGFGSQTWGRFFLFILLGLLYIVAGAFALAQPLLAAAVLTLMLGWALIATGARLKIHDDPCGDRDLAVRARHRPRLAGQLVLRARHHSRPRPPVLRGKHDCLRHAASERLNPSSTSAVDRNGRFGQ
jgi:hypothetical protein